MFKLEKSLQNGDVMANVVSFGTSRVQNLKIRVQNLTPRHDIRLRLRHGRMLEEHPVP